MGAGSVPTHRKTSGALYHRLPAGNMPRRGKFHARAAFPTTATASSWNASGRDLPVLFLKQPEPSVHVAVGPLEQPLRAAAALVNDAIALGLRADAALVPSDCVRPCLTRHGP